MQYYRDQYASIGETLPPCNLFLQQWGNSSDAEPYGDLPPGGVELVPALERNYRDAVDIDGLEDSPLAIQLAEIGNPFHAQGIATCYAFSAAIATALAAEINSRGLDYFGSCHFDVEKYLVSVDDVLPSSEGWWSATLDDPRYTVELVDGVSTFQSYWTSATTLGGDPVTVNTSAGPYTLANRDHHTWLRNYINTSHIYALSQSIVLAFNEVFEPLMGPIKWSNWNHHGCSRTHPTAGNKAYSPWYEMTSLGSLTHGAIVAYAFEDTQFGSGSTVADWLDYFGLTSTGNTGQDIEQCWIARVHDRVNAHLATLPGVPLLIWFDWPGRVYYLSNVDGGIFWTMPQDEYIELMLWCLETANTAGVEVEFFVWVDPNQVNEDDYDVLDETLRAVVAGAVV
jgi:hypothetical protein